MTRDTPTEYEHGYENGFAHGKAAGVAAERQRIPGTDVRFYDDDADLVAECPCSWHAHGDAATDAFRWCRHRAEKHADLLDGGGQDTP